MSLMQTVPFVNESKPITREISAPKAEYNVSIGYLRAFITVLVVAHHAALAYAPLGLPVAASLDAQPRWWQAFPIIDTQKWSGASLIVGFNDSFFMSLMFFISGLFVYKSLQRKQIGGFLRDRSMRLGIPFLGAAAIIAPLAYYPTYLQIGNHGVGGFMHQWLSLGNWPAGPAWFVWLLLAFDCVVAELYFMKPNWAEVAGCFFARFSAKPIRFTGYLIGVSAAVYIPLAMKFNPITWTQLGPFAFQTSRILHYFVYFLVGVAVGAYGIERGILASEGKLARRWWLWAIRAVVVFLLSSWFYIVVATTKAASVPWNVALNLLFIITCAVISMAMLAVFVRFAKKSNSVWDSLTKNAYGIYLIHYAFVSWLQLSLLKVNMSGFAKLSVVLVSAVLLSWITTAALRKIPAVGRLI